MQKDKAERIKNIERYVLKSWITAVIMGAILRILVFDIKFTDTLFSNMLIISGIATILSLPLVVLFLLLINFMVKGNLRIICIKSTIVLIGLGWIFFITVLASPLGYAFLLHYSFASISFYCYTLSMSITFFLFKLKISEENRSI